AEPHAKHDARTSLPELHHQGRARRASDGAGGRRLMRNALSIAGKELRSYFVSPVAYVVITGFLLLGGWFFFNLLARFNFLLQIYSSMRNPEAQARLNLNEFVISPLLHNLSVVLIILLPVITLRCFTYS